MTTPAQTSETRSEYEVRKVKVQQLRDIGIVPYAQGYNKQHSIADLIGNNEKNLTDGHVSPFRDINDIITSPRTDRQTAGRLTLYRAHGKLSFGRLMDESGEIQLMFHRDSCALVEAKRNTEMKKDNQSNKYLIFDFDGVLADTFDCGNECMVRLGVADTVEQAGQRVLEYSNKKPNYTMSTGDMTEYKKGVKDRATMMLDVGFPLFEEFIGYVRDLNPSHCAIVSSNDADMIAQIMNGCGLSFTHILGFGDHHSKEEKIQTICNDRGVKVSDVYYFTDTKADVYELQDFINPDKLIGCAWGHCGYDFLAEVLDTKYILKNPEDVLSLFNGLADILGVITNETFGVKRDQSLSLVEKKATRAIIMNEKNEVLLMYSQTSGFYKLPGGGLDEGESIEQCLLREVKEETGYSMIDYNSLGVVIEYREYHEDTLHYTNYGFVAKIKTDQKEAILFTQEEKEAQYTLIRKPLDEAIELMKSNLERAQHSKENLMSVKFMSKREELFLHAVKDKFLLTGSEATKFLEKLVDIGDFLGVRGELFHTHKGELTLFVSEFSFLAKALRPLGDKFHGIAGQETAYRQRYLDMIHNRETLERMKLRSTFIRTLREFYRSHGFIELETPILGTSASGAAAQPFITHHNDFDTQMYLRIAPEIALKMATVGGLEKVFEIGKDFRNEGSSPAHHQEFTVAEHYAAYWNYEDNMRFTEEMFDYLFDHIPQLKRKVNIADKEGVVREVDFTTPRPRIDYIAQIHKDSGIDVSAYSSQDEERLRADILVAGHTRVGIEKQGTATMIDYLYKKVTRPKIVGPAFIYNYPKAMQPLARSADSDANIAEQFQCIVNGWEILKAYSELVDPLEQQSNFDEQAGAVAKGDEEATKGDDEFVKAMEYGMPCQSGWGMGLERIFAMLTEQSNIRDVILFPMMKPEHTREGGMQNDNQKEEKKSDTPEKKVSLEMTSTLQIPDSKPSILPFSDEMIAGVESLARKHLTDTLLHCTQVAGCMRYFARKLNLTEVEQDYRYAVGLLHDVDRDVIGKDPEKHLGERFEEIIGELSLDDIQYTQLLADIRSHYPSKYPDPQYAASTPVRQYLLAVDELSGLMYAYARMRGGSFEGMETKGVIKKIKDKSFAAGVDREHVRHCEVYLGVSLEEFVAEMIEAMKSV